MSKQLSVIISSTARDLPEHRQEVMDACLRQGMFPKMMEHLPANDAEAISASLKLVDEADIYIGVFAYRYGYTPKQNNSKEISITEMEYDRAIEHNIPRLIFFMDNAHQITIDNVEQGKGATKLQTFKERLQTENIINFYKSPVDLRAHIINSLSAQRIKGSIQTTYVNEIPSAPETYIAHPYTLLQKHRLVGRQAELNLLTDWVAKPETEINKTPVLVIAAIGGMGKSALTWKWFKDISSQEMKPLAGRLWWSFYEPEATFEAFITHALAYVKRQSLDEMSNLLLWERETQLLATLNREPFLITLDGLERILIAYSRMDAARVVDSKISEQRGVRKTIDPRVGRFLQRLAQLKSSRILISTRLYPADLETEGIEPVSGSYRHELKGLTDEDAIELWRTFHITGPRDLLLPIFAAIDKHPLLIQALAGEVKRYRPAPGDFEEWWKANQQFDPTQFPRLRDAMNHVLKFALIGLDENEQQTLYYIAAFRMAVHFDTISALLIGLGKSYNNVQELDASLTNLEDRGLIGWNKISNRYDLHPVVRAVVWNNMGPENQQGIFSNLHSHLKERYFEEEADNHNARLYLRDFDIEKWKYTSKLEDLSPTIEMYNVLIGLERYNDAFDLFRSRLYYPALYILSASLQCIELLEMLFTKENLNYVPLFESDVKEIADVTLLEKIARGYLQSPEQKRNNFAADALSILGLAYDWAGQPGRASELYFAAKKYRSHETGSDKSYTEHKDLNNISNALRLTGNLYKAEKASKNVLNYAQGNSINLEGSCLAWLGLVLSTRGSSQEAEAALLRAIKINKAIFQPENEAVSSVFLVEHYIWSGDLTKALNTIHVLKSSGIKGLYKRLKIRIVRREGELLLKLNMLTKADECLHYALSNARSVYYVEEELPALILLAELQRLQGNSAMAREMLNAVWEVAERGPYNLFLADAYNLLAQIEIDVGNKQSAIESAIKAYKLAWCDGPPFAYYWGLEIARKHLKALNIKEPALPSFDVSSLEPMPDVMIGTTHRRDLGN